MDDPAVGVDADQYLDGAQDDLGGRDEGKVLRRGKRAIRELPVNFTVVGSPACGGNFGGPASRESGSMAMGEALSWAAGRESSEGGLAS